MKLDSEEQKLMDALQQALRFADSLSQIMVAIKISEAIDAFWANKGNRPPE